MFKLRRFHVDTIGVQGNRFVDVTIDATDLADEPCDTIVWLRNGAGKTTMLSLLLALVLPARRDFLASRVKRRTLEDLVAGSDTAHVIAEWVDPRGQRLLTGAVYQWENRVRPREYNGEGKNRLRRYWWCLNPDETVDGATFETIPTTSRTKGAVDLDRFIAHIGSLASQGVNATGADNRIGEWHDTLRQRRFDPDLFRYFAEVNATEGGIDALFSGIESARAFVRYLLRFVADERRVAPVRDLLGETAAEIAKRPVYAAERDFCAQARPQVALLGEQHAKVITAASERDEVRIMAAGFKRALLDTADEADEAATAATEQAGGLEQKRVELRQRTDTARRRRDEYKRLAAEFRVGAAHLGADAARTRARTARLDADAWAAVPDRAAVVEAEAVLEMRRRALHAAAEEAAPQRAAYESARADLAGSLDYHLAELDAQLAELDEAQRTAEGRKEEAEQARVAAIEERAALGAEQTGHNRVIERIERRLRELVERAIVAAEERPATAAARLETAVNSHADAVHRTEDAIAKATIALADARQRLPAVRHDAEQAAQRHGVLARQAADLAAATAELAVDRRLRELVQADDLDPIDESNDLLIALGRAITAGDAAALDLRVEGADDDRAIAGLEAEGILPARPAVTRVIDALKAEGIAGQPGWRYLKEHHSADAGDIVSRRPEIADGVVVYGDPHAAAEAIDGLTVADPVVVARAGVFTEPSAEQVVVGPSRARYDPSAAAVELQMRQGRATTRSARLKELAETRRNDETLAARLRHLLERVPDDGVNGLAVRVEKALSEAESAATERDRLTERATDLEKDLDDLRSEREDRRTEFERAKGALTEVSTLLRDEREEGTPARVRLGVLPDLIGAAMEAEQAAADAAGAADRLVDTCRRGRAELEPRRREWATERSGLGEAVPNQRPLDACRAQLAIAEEALRIQFPESELHRAVEEARARTEEVTKRYQAHKVEARTRAERFYANDPSAQEIDLRVAALERAREENVIAQRRLGVAEREVTDAAEELKANTPTDRVRHTPDLPTEPTDRHHAQILAGAAGEEADGLQLEVGRLERERDDAADRAKIMKIRATMLRDQADKLLGVPTAEVAVGEVDRDDARVRQDVAAAVQRVSAADAMHQNAMSARSQRADQLRTWALQDRFARIADDEHGMAVRQLRDLLRGENLIERVAPRAADLAADLATREKAITQQIAQVETHKRNVVSRLGDLVAEALADLTRASTLSELPEGVGPWAGQQFLSVTPRNRPTPDQVQVRVGELVEQMVTVGKVDLDPVELLWRATDAAVIDGFRATILKPAPDQPPGREPVENMHKWSGGENLTASLVLFCVLAKLRTENRTGAKAGAAGGVVPLDNPLGKANYLPFLELQRRVAAANGVQLLFWTGIGDLAAVGAFPRITAMRKKPAAGRAGIAYVVADGDASHVVERVSAVRAERPS